MHDHANHRGHGQDPAIIQGRDWSRWMRGERTWPPPRRRRRCVDFTINGAHGRVCFVTVFFSLSLCDGSNSFKFVLQSTQRERWRGTNRGGLRFSGHVARHGFDGGNVVHCDGARDVGRRDRARDHVARRKSARGVDGRRGGDRARDHVARRERARGVDGRRGGGDAPGLAAGPVCEDHGREGGGLRPRTRPRNRGGGGSHDPGRKVLEASVEMSICQCHSYQIALYYCYDRISDPRIPLQSQLPAADCLSIYRWGHVCIPPYPPWFCFPSQLRPRERRVHESKSGSVAGLDEGGKSAHRLS